MTIRTNNPVAQSAFFFRTGLALALLAGVAGCSGSLSSILEPERVDYKSASKASSRTLEIPPNLTQLQRDNRYAVPDANNRGTATASGYNLQQGARVAAAPAAIAPNSAADMRIERNGNHRWLVVKQSPDALWSQIRDFWQDMGFLINVETPETGVMETDWAESRMKVPQGMIRSSLGKILDSVYDTGERDKFRTRLERGPDGSTEIYISHRGAQEVYVGSGTNRGQDSTVWTTRPQDPELEAQMLARLMTRLGTEDGKAKAAVASASQAQARAKLVKGTDGVYVEADEGFDRAWRRVGLALDRVGFTVEDRDRSQGVYFVRYIDQDADAKNKPASEKGFLSRLFSSNDDSAKTAQRYRISVKETGSNSRIMVLNNEGRPEVSAIADKILALLNDQLK
ncbi:MAG: outer membrane protein assembly factor BamC [Burkholderiales bacterium]|nr:outer membrane protein assembly factor BamC [Burkholderiales bacterium]